jgi:hypothetical protein
MKQAERDVINPILATSSNLLGICFLIMSFIKINNLGAQTNLDECLTAPIVLFFTSSIISYLSLRSTTRSRRLENTADWIFMIGLFSLTVISLIYIIETWR